MAVANTYNVITFVVIPEQRKDYTMGKSGMHIIAGIYMYCVVFAVLLAIKNTSVIPGINTLLNWHKELCAKFGHSERTELFDILMIIMVIVVWGVPFVIFYCALYFNIDPIYYLLEDFFMTDAIYRSNTEILCAFGIRVIFMLGAFETARSTSFIGLIFLIVCNRMNKCAQILLTHNLNNGYKRLVKYYKEFILVYHVYKQMLQDFLSLVISALFWVIVAEFWIILKGYETVPLFMYLLVITLGVGSLCVYVTALIVVTKLGEDCTQVVVKCRKESRAEPILFKTKQIKKEKLCLKLEAIALHPITIGYVPFLTIDRDLLMALLYNEVDRLVDALCIFG
ncbi:unnamed protein product [Orchesella dallaii]|uniref:Gustatory receptor n=1 Tax=Orchesella dallaii TaxID=48710 RepID=A0ABP1QUE2_9HEXA